MSFKNVSYIFAVTLSLGAGSLLFTSAQNNPIQDKVQAIITSSVPKSMGIGKVKVNKIDVNSTTKEVAIDLKENYAYLPLTKDSVEQITEKIAHSIGNEYKDYTIKLTIEGEDIHGLLPSKLNRWKNKDRFMTHMNPNYKFSKGLDGNIIALWQSHGWYFEPKLNRWEWQRARIFQTVEDLYTQSYVLPFLVPMLENAGAYVFSPRERDTNTVEIIVDNDKGLGQNGYKEVNGKESWQKGDGNGFAYTRKEYKNLENPFIDGTYRQVTAVSDRKKVSTANWEANFPTDGDYAVYVSYKTLPNSAKDAIYTINHKGGSDVFRLNQQMGGGTWIYLGTFPFEKGQQSLPVVSLSNYSKHDDAVITADAVKIGGGYGNIARIVSGISENVKSSDAAKSKVSNNIEDIDYKYQISNYPRFTEGARYWLQWAGIPDSVYTPSGNVNDYTDDYRCRGVWVNYLAGGSKVLPNNKGLNLPVDIAFAFHSDAGTTMNDSIIGTLGIYYTNQRAKYADGTPRMASRELTNNIMTSIVNDVRAQYEPNWTRRGMWDKSYYEARVPEVPTMLLELLSHQNFADMKYGLDPTFRFTVSRAIYKGMLKFISDRDGRQYMVQPLPVNSFAITPMADNRFLLRWVATPDTLSANSDASEFIVMERINKGAFKQIAVTKTPQFTVTVDDNDIHSYQIIAMNKGGRSFPSETLALGVAKKSQGEVLVVNGFTRVSAPDTFDSGKMAGFYDEKDHGVPYIKDINYIGSQFEYRRDLPWRDDDAAGFGASRANYEDKVIAGNTFDYPYIHGEAIMKAGYSFVSSSLKAVESDAENLNNFKYVDLILGKQKEVTIGRGAVPNRYKAFTPALKNAIIAYTKNGGNIFISGAYVASDIWDNVNAPKSDKNFAEKILGYSWRVGQASVTGEAYVVPTTNREITPNVYKFNNELNDKMYMVESPDALFPSNSAKSQTVMRYKENNLPAGVVSAMNGYRTFVMGFPFETINSENERATLMTQILNYLSK